MCLSIENVTGIFTQLVHRCFRDNTPMILILIGYATMLNLYNDF